jgi:hypothetical protein
MKKSSYAATHYGECQLCGHVQKLPGGGLLSLHGYEVRWNSFQGTCPGSRHLPYEQATNLLAGEIERQRAVIARLKRDVREITSPSFKDVFVEEFVPANGKQRSYYAPRRLSPAEYTVKGTSRIDWMSLERGSEKSKAKNIVCYESRSVEALIAFANRHEVAAIKGNIKTREEYCVWLQERIDNFMVRELRPVPVEEQGVKGPVVHFAAKRYGYDASYCTSSALGASESRFKHVKSNDWAKVTCKACLKQKAAADAQVALSAKADALVAEMVAKHGEGVKVRWNPAADRAVKEIRYQRKDIDKAVRSLACSRIEDGRVK